MSSHFSEDTIKHIPSVGDIWLETNVLSSIEIFSIGPGVPGVVLSVVLIWTKPTSTNDYYATRTFF